MNILPNVLPIVLLHVVLYLQLCNSETRDTCDLIMNSVPSNMSNDKLCVAAWNSRGLKAAQPYLGKLTSQADIVIITEHHLYESQLYKLNEINRDFDSFGKCTGRLEPAPRQNFVPAHGGVAILWNKALSCKVKPLRNLGTDRICAVELYTNSGCISVIGVYLPHAGHGLTEYQKHLDVLEHVIEQCSLGGDVIVMGDFNAHVGQEDQLPRGWGRTTANGRRLLDMLSRCAMTPVDLSTICEGPEHTFENGRGHMSYVDHCVISNYCVENVLSCNVLDDVLNTSDHLALSCTLDLKNILVRDVMNAPVSGPKVAWHKMSKLEIECKYSVVVDAMLSDSELLTDPDCGAGDIRDAITKHVQLLENVFKEVSMNLPTVKFNKHLKPYWHKGLSQSVARKRAAWQKWVNAGKHRDNSPMWVEYKAAKKQFRMEQRRASAEHETKFLNEVAKTQEIDQKLFWKLVNNRRKPKNSQPHPVKDKEGATVREIDKIVKVWKDYYDDLYTPKTLEHFDNQFKLMVDQEIREIDMTPRNDGDVLDNPISTGEVKEACQSLKVGKASGLDGVQGEHLKYAGPTTHTYLAKLFNCMTTAEWRPLSMRKGIIVPIPKGDKDRTIPDNNRGITLRSVLGKVYDKILLKRADEWFQSNMHEQQGANRIGCSSVNTALILKETISYNQSRGKPVYTALLDTRKAFDTVWQNGLFYKLREQGMDTKLWRILKNVYDEFQCAVTVGGKLSDWFHPQQGVHQGDVFSMKMYGSFNNGLIKELAESGHGAKIGTIVCSNPTFADDIALVALIKMVLNIMLNIAYQYSCKWRFLYGVDKTQGLVFGEDRRPDLPIKMGNEVISVSDEGNHLGTPLHSKQGVEDGFIAAKISVCRKCYFSLEGIGSGGRGFDPVTLSKLYWAVCVPKMLYGIEVTDISAKSMDRLETAHSEFGRIIQGLHPLSARPVNYANLGWRCIKAHIDVCRLVFLFGIISLSSSALSCKIVIKRWTECRFTTNTAGDTGPVRMLYSTAMRYGLVNDINGMLDTGVIPSKNVWKRKVKQTVDSVYLQRWIVECHLYSSLHVFVQVVTKVQLNVWWVVCRKNPQLKHWCNVMIKLITGDHNLSSGRRQYTVNSRTCQLCETNDETIDHFMFVCSRLRDVRETLWSDVLASMPRPMAEYTNNMCNQEKVIFILSGFRSSYLAEWNDIYVKLLRFVGRLYISATNMRPTTE